MGVRVRDDFFCRGRGMQGKPVSLPVAMSHRPAVERDDLASMTAMAARCRRHSTISGPAVT
jgi:hypothetical protein